MAVPLTAQQLSAVGRANDPHALLADVQTRIVGVLEAIEGPGRMPPARMRPALGGRRRPVDLVPRVLGEHAGFFARIHAGRIDELQTLERPEALASRIELLQLGAEPVVIAVIAAAAVRARRPG